MILLLEKDCHSSHMTCSHATTTYLQGDMAKTLKWLIDMSDDLLVHLVHSHNQKWHLSIRILTPRGINLVFNAAVRHSPSVLLLWTLDFAKLENYPLQNILPIQSAYQETCMVPKLWWSQILE